MSKTRRMVLIAMLAALSTILLLPILQFPLLPGIDFMKVELNHSSTYWSLYFGIG